MTIINKAVKILEKQAAKYKEKRDSNYISFVNEDDRIVNFEQFQDETYCEDCIELAIIKAKKDKELILPSGFQSFTWQTETSKEGEGFLSCSNCEEIIHQALIESADEYWHWLNMTDDDFKNAIKKPRDCFQILELLCNFKSNEVLNIALRVVNFSKQ